jgi:hypothetical protein
VDDQRLSELMKAYELSPSSASDPEAAMVAFVQFIARCSAETDFSEISGIQNSSKGQDDG